MAARCSFCGATSGPFTKVEGMFMVLMWADPGSPAAAAAAPTRS
jgi:hypothetical protein